MVLIFQPDVEPDPGTRYISEELNLRDLFVVPLGLWSKRTPLHPPEPLAHPVENVIVSWTNSPECETEGECVQNMWDLQQKYRDLGQDIPFNFVVGGDANVYECRGWQKTPAKCDRHPDIHGSSIEIAHMSYKKEDGERPHVGMALAVWKLCDWGIAKGYLVDEILFRPDYEVLHGTILSEANRHNLSDVMKTEETNEENYDVDVEEHLKKYSDKMGDCDTLDLGTMFNEKT